ncbi:hypothetical protein [Paenarthrobacter sp. CAP02]|uniref:hypothetical protein n=1 Tax=Paenarthrobacter sp. CAP02 TaxID=3158144 RepID=UPI0032DBE4C1
MSTVESLVQTTSGLRHLQLLSGLVDWLPLSGERQVDVSELYTLAKLEERPRESVTSDLEALQEHRWIWFEKPGGGIDSVVVTQAGIDAAEDFKTLRTDPRRRVKEIRDAVLNWLYDEQLKGANVFGISDFLKSSKNHFLGEPYSEEELARASNWLIDEEYIDGTKTWGAELLRPTITTRGSKVIEAEQSVNKALDAAGVTNNVTITGSQAVNVALQSSNVTQSNSMTRGQVEVVERILGSVRAMLNPMVLGVSDDVTTEAQNIANEVDGEIHSPAPDAAKVRALLLKLVDLAATGAVQGDVDALNAMMQQGINGIG